MGWPELEWSDVERTAKRWEPWTDEHLTLDAVHDREDNVRIAAKYARTVLDASSHNDA